MQKENSSASIINNGVTFTEEHTSVSPLALYSEYQRMEIELRTPEAMPLSHWHGQVEVNVAFDDDIEYIINGEVVHIKQGHITMFWACVPHRLSNPGQCKSMAIFNLPMHLFLSWPINRELINHITHGMVVQSTVSQQISEFEIRRWQQELQHKNEQIKQLTIDEIGLMIKRFGLSSWTPLLVNHTPKSRPNGVSRHAQFYVSRCWNILLHTTTVH